MRLPAKSLALGLAAGLVTAPLAFEARAQVPVNEIRALNFARNTGVRLNGGLTVYRPQDCMFSTSAPTNPCLVRRDPLSFTYRFLGGPPGWQAMGLPPTLETELQVSSDGITLVALIYNGPPRSPSWN
jgi:hypothetical protein